MAHEACAMATDLLRDAIAARIPLAAALRLVEPLLRKLPRATPAERARAAGRVLRAFAPFGDWSGAVMVVNTFRVERELTAIELADELAAFLDRLAAGGHDLYRGLAWLAGAQGAGEEQPTNRQLLRASGSA